MWLRTHLFLCRNIRHQFFQVLLPQNQMKYWQNFSDSASSILNVGKHIPLEVVLQEIECRNLITSAQVVSSPTKDRSVFQTWIMKQLEWAHLSRPKLSLYTFRFSACRSQRSAPDSGEVSTVWQKKSSFNFQWNAEMKKDRSYARDQNNRMTSWNSSPR